MYSFSDHAKALLETYYMKDEDGSIEEAFRRAAYAYASSPELAQRIYEYACKGWFMFSSPILSNANGSGMPISCFLTYVEDTVEGLIEHTEELRWMSVMGGGVGGHWDHIRSVSKKSVRSPSSRRWTLIWSLTVRVKHVKDLTRRIWM